MIGQTISHYRIIEKLGEGGMGIVYKAEDTKLERTVALKFLPHHITASDKEKARFLQEAKTAAALNHPNVCVIHEIQDQGDQPFIVMEFVEGQTLRDMVREENRGPLKIEDAVAYALQFADALREAHSKDIVHRDIKSDNVMVNTKNQIKVMDFGLAKLKGAARLTKTASTLGTLGYMAPEQLQGSESDARADIFSFGVVLYEMLTGRLPFRGDYEAAMMYSILNEDPEPLESHRTDVPSGLSHIINRSLEKVADDRYQSMSDLLIDLRRLKRDSSRVSRQSLSEIGVADARGSATAAPRTEPPAPGKRKRRLPLVAAGVFAGLAALIVAGYFSFFGGPALPEGRLPIAVADFVNETDEKELDGLSGMLITALEQSRRLSVLTRSRMFDVLRLMGKEDADRIDEDLGRQICQQANIGALVTASIRKFGRLYTIDLKVLDPEKNEYLFTAKEQAEGQERIPDMLDKLSEKTRAGLKEQMAHIGAAEPKVADITTSNLEAYQHFFQGEQLINRLKFKEAQEEFREAVALDSTFGLAYYRLAYAIAWNSGSEGLAREPMRRAMALIDRIPEKERYLLRSENARIESGMGAALVILREMEQKYPDDKEMLYIIGDYSYHEVDFGTAAEYLERVLSVDPNHQRALQHLAWTYRDTGQHDKMLEVATRYASVAGNSESYNLLASASAVTGQLERGLASLEQARNLFPERYGITAAIANLHAELGDYARAKIELKSLIAEDQPPEARRVGYQSASGFYSFIGEYREAMRVADGGIRFFWEAGDTSRAIAMNLSKALLMVWGWKDVDAAWKTVETTFPFRDRYGAADYWGGLTLMHLYHGDYATADSLSRLGWWWNMTILSVTHSLQHECGQAEAYADTTLTLGVPFAKILVLYHLAECQLATEDLEGAIGSLSELQTIYDDAWARLIFYPKSFYLLGKIYEKKGDPKLSLQNYEKFLEMWKDADEDLPELIDARSRLARLKEGAS